MSELDMEKLIYERLATLLRDPQLVTVYREFGWDAAFRRSSVLEDFEKFVQATDFRGRCCVEIGTLTGLTAAVLARYFTSVVTIDVVAHPLAPRVLEMMGATNVRRVVVRDNAEKAAVVREIDFDAAFVDGDHFKDTETDTALVRRCGHLLFHEHWDSQPAVIAQVKALELAGGRVVRGGKWAHWRAA